MSQNGLKHYFIYDVTQKICNPQPKFFRVQTRRQADAFEPLNSSLEQSAEELWCW